MDHRLARTLLLTTLGLFGALGVAGPAGAATGPRLTVDATVGQHPISPRIYGLNFADRALAASIDLPVDRWGGNTTDAYNWRRGAANTAGSTREHRGLSEGDDGWCANGPVAATRGS